MLDARALSVFSPIATVYSLTFWVTWSTASPVVSSEPQIWDIADFHESEASTLSYIDTVSSENTSPP